MRTYKDLAEEIFKTAMAQSLNKDTIDTSKATQAAEESLLAAEMFYLIAYGEMTK